MGEDVKVVCYVGVSIPGFFFLGILAIHVELSQNSKPEIFTVPCIELFFWSIIDDIVKSQTTGDKKLKIESYINE